MRVTKKHVMYALAVTTGLLWQSPGFCQGNIVIQPRIKTYVENNSNFWRAENDEVSVNTYAIQPGLNFQFNTAKTKVEIDASVNSFTYDDNDTLPVGVEAADEYDYTGFTGVAAVSNQATDRLKIGIEDSLFITRDPASSDEFNDSVAREKYTINRVTPDLYYDFGNKFGVGTKYRNTLTDYDENGEDSNENRGIVDLFYNLNRSSTVFVDYQIWARDYDLSSSDYTSNEASLNFAKKMNYFTFTVGGGYHIRTFDDDILDDIDGFIWKISVDGQDRVEEGVNPRSRVGLSLAQNLNDYGTGDEYYTATKASLYGTYNITDKFEAGADFSYQNSDYENDPNDRDDDTLTLAGRLGYRIGQFFVVGLEGGIKDRDSNIVGESYDDTFIMAKLDFIYDTSK